MRSAPLRSRALAAALALLLHLGLFTAGWQAAPAPAPPALPRMPAEPVWVQLRPLPMPSAPPVATPRAPAAAGLDGGPGGAARKPADERARSAAGPTPAEPAPTALPALPPPPVGLPSGTPEAADARIEPAGRLTAPVPADPGASAPLDLRWRGGAGAGRPTAAPGAAAETPAAAAVRAARQDAAAERPGTRIGAGQVEESRGDGRWRVRGPGGECVDLRDTRAGALFPFDAAARSRKIAEPCD